MAVDINNIDLIKLDINYNIQWKECSCLKGIRLEDVTVELEKKHMKKYTEAIYKYRTNTGKMTASDYTHLFGYLNPYYRSAYNIPKRRK